MITGIILLNTVRSKINEVAEELTEIEGITEVYSVSGEFDLVAIVRVQNSDDLAEVVTKKMLNVGGITKTQTMIAFRAFSKHDLDRMFTME